MNNGWFTSSGPFNPLVRVLILYWRPSIVLTLHKVGVSKGSEFEKINSAYI